MTNSLRKLFILSSVMWVFLGQAAFGEETNGTQFPDRLKIWGGYQYLFGLDATLRFDGSRTNFGTSIDWEDDLNGETTDSMIRAGLEWRIAPNHALQFSFYAMNFDGDGSIDQDFQIDDTIFQVGARVKSDLDLDLYRFLYSYSFYRRDKVELRISPGMYFAEKRQFNDKTWCVPRGLPNKNDQGIAICSPAHGGVFSRLQDLSSPHGDVSC